MTECKPLLSATSAAAPPVPAVMAAPVPDPVPAAHVGHVAVRLPEFWMADPEFWFLQADAVFDTSAVTRSVSYTHLTLPTICSV